MAFKSVKGSGNTWNPTKDRDGNDRTEASPDDYIDGYYIDRRDGVGQHSATVYTIEKDDGEKVDVWGTTALNGHMDKIRLGSYTRIQWLGKKPTKAGALKPANKRNSTDTFHDWDVMVDDEVAPLPVKGSQRPAATPHSTGPASTGSTSTSYKKPVAQQEEDLPF